MSGGYVFATSACIGCGRLFSYNPHLVPSLVVKGVREPVCAGCVERANPERKARGLKEIQVLPGAYEACAEEDL